MIRYAVLVATGHPSHSSQLIQDRPPAMLPAIGKPMLVRVAERLYRAGIRHFIFIVGLNEGAVAAYLKKQWVPDAHTEFMLETEQENTLSLLSKIAQQIKEPFMVASYNSFTHENFTASLLAQHEENPQALILSGARFALAQPAHPTYIKAENGQFISVESTRPRDDSALLLVEHAIFGHSAIETLSQLSAPFPTGHYLQMAIQFAKAHPDSTKVSETAWVLCVERDYDLLLLNRKLLEEAQDTHILSELHQTVRIIPPVRIDPQVTVGQGATIGPHVYLERGSSVGQGANISNAVVLNRGSVHAKQTIVNTIISPRGTITA